MSTLAKPTTIFKRSNTPFTAGNGVEVMLLGEPGYTTAGWLTTPFRFQFPPLDKIDRTAGHNRPTFQVLGGEDGPHERSRSEGPKLQVVTFKAMFLDWEPDWQVWSPDVLEPQLAAAELEAIARAGIRFRLRIRNASLWDYDDVNMLATLTEANVAEEGGETDARYVNLSFMEWRATQIETKLLANVFGPWTHKVKPGETLYAIARNYYKTYALWRLIAAANGLTNVAPSTPLLTVTGRPGHLTEKLTGPAVLKIPAKPSANARVTPGERETQAIQLP